MSRRFSSSATTALLFWTPTTVGFSPVSLRTHHYQHHGARSTSTTRLFDSEELMSITSSLLQESFTTTTGDKVFNPNVEFDLQASEFSALTKTSGARAQMGKFGHPDTNNDSKAKSSSKALESEFPKRKITASVRETGTDSMKNYIKTMCNHELLNKNEEIILAREIQILLKWETEREQLEEKLLRYVFKTLLGMGTCQAPGFF
jgi:hypothetical protein